MGRKKKSLEPNITTASVERPGDYSAEETILFMEKKEWFTGDIKYTKDRGNSQEQWFSTCRLRPLQGFTL